ncbi:hypothetical protein [Desulfatibacillum aliphaticivorans]|uniref:Uncharacterized protein n=1 Tax=Desulfatibacillum aliphaticivorans TaxID=218208 RepID=B8FMR9_DESAL|nr:hypothetical protein [Desulfatibacillum aliphaticivorans]ACL01936.1 hypothetical protein Dalk_0227 [Desulfatibacillum aliphaticivorans]
MHLKPYFDPHSPFMSQYTPRFLERFDLSFHDEGLCTEYFIETLDEHQTISSALVLSQNTFANNLHVSRFYPELAKRTNCKYMSAVAFYLMIHHFSQTHHLNNQCRISLDTTNRVFDQFYSHLLDFNFCIRRQMAGGNVALISDYCHDKINLAMIHPHAEQDDGPAFLYT